MSETYLPYTRGGRWAISRQIGERWVALIEDAVTEFPGDVQVVLKALGIPPTAANIGHYFPVHESQEGRCPTLELLELFAGLGSAIKQECGV